MTQGQASGNVITMQRTNDVVVMQRSKIAALHIGARTIPVVVTQETFRDGLMGVVGRIKSGKDMWALVEMLRELEHTEYIAFSGEMPESAEFVVYKDWLITAIKPEGYMEVYPEEMGDGQRLLTVVWGGTRESIYSGRIRLGNSL